MNQGLYVQRAAEGEGLQGREDKVAGGSLIMTDDAGNQATVSDDAGAQTLTVTLNTMPRKRLPTRKLKAL